MFTDSHRDESNVLDGGNVAQIVYAQTPRVLYSSAKNRKGIEFALNSNSKLGKENFVNYLRQFLQGEENLGC